MRRSRATIRYGAGRLLVFVGALALGWSVLTGLTDGFSFHAGVIALSSRDPLRPLAVGLAAFAAARLLLSGSEYRHSMLALTGGYERGPARVAVAAAVASMVVSVAWGTRAAGGSDSSCYVLQAAAFSQGRLALVEPLAKVMPGATPGMFAPAGFLPSRREPFAAVPICGPGLSLAMAIARIAGSGGVFFVVPLTAALGVWLTFLLGRSVDDDVTGAAAAVLLATSPIFLYQSVQPMSDVPAASMWLAALVLLARGDARAQVAAGLCASLAILIRPNVALIVLPLFLLLPDVRSWVRFAAAAAPGLVGLAWLNAARYGSPLASGYGSTDALFSLAHVWPNLARYPRWLFATETPFIAAAAIAPLAGGESTRRSLLIAVALAAVTLTFATYLAYTVFDDWWYLRFLLPALPVLLVLSVSVVLRAAGAALGAGRSRAIVALLLCVGLSWWHLRVARARQVFELQALESRFPITGRYAAHSLPADAVALAVQQSGSIRYYSGRTTIAWDAVPVDALDDTLAWLRAHGRSPYIVVEDAEEPAFRRRFSTERHGALDWPPRAEINAPVRVHVYDPDDRERYLAGAGVATAHVR